MTVAITQARYLEYIESELDAFLAAARSVTPDATVRSYPRYTVGTLAGHVAEILKGVTDTIETGVFTVPAADHMPPRRGAHAGDPPTGRSRPAARALLHQRTTGRGLLPPLPRHRDRHPPLGCRERCRPSSTDGRRTGR